jgi:RHS repeat-associated protein
VHYSALVDSVNAPANGTVIRSTATAVTNGGSGGGATAGVDVRVGGFVVPPPTPGPTLAFTPATFDFGQNLVGTRKDLILSVTNSGVGTLSGSVTTAVPFSIVAGSSFSLGAGASQPVTLRFSADSPPRILNGSANISTNGGSASVPLIGESILPPVLQITTSSPVAFGSQTLLTARTLPVSVRNVGGGILSVAPTTQGSIDFQVGAMTLQLGAGESASFSVQYRPTTAGPATGSLSLVSNGGSPQSIALSGTGTYPGSSLLGVVANFFHSGSAAEPVNTATGNYYYQHTDIRMPGRGMPVVLSRTYNAQSGQPGPFGIGWTHSYNVSLNERSDGVVIVTRGDGAQHLFDPSGGAYIARIPGVFDVLAKNADGSFVLTAKDQTQQHFTSIGRLASANDRNGNALQFAYDGAGNLVSITDTVGRSVALSYDAANRIAQIADPLARVLKYEYGAAGDLVKWTDARGGTMTFAYDATHRVTRIVDRRGNTLIANVYDSNGRVISQGNGRGFTSSFAYGSPTASDTSITDPLGNVSVHTHDPLFRLIRETDPLGHFITYGYDSNNNRTGVTDRNGNTTAFAYDAKANVTSKLDALGNATLIQYNALNDPISKTDALGKITLFAYDAKGNLTSVTDPVGTVSRIAYDAFGQPVTLTDALGRVTTATFDALGNLTQVRDALNGLTRSAYDAIGRRVSVTNANGGVTGFAYDANGNLLSTTDALGQQTRVSYDANDNRTSVTDPRGGTASFAYNENDLLVRITDALNNVVSLNYDASDRRTSVTDQRGNITRLGYDAAGRLVRRTNALDQVTQLGYDAAGNLLALTNALGHTTTLAYDALNRRTSAADALGNTNAAAYDALGRVSRTTDANGRVTAFEYDALGRLTKVTDPAGGTATYAYDAVGNKISVTDPNSHTNRYAYDALNRLVTKTDPLDNAYRYTYDALGNRLQRTDAKGQTTQYGYDLNNSLLTILYPDASRVTFTYDTNGNRVRMVDSLGTSTYAFDAMNRLNRSTDAFGKAVGYEYDVAGNRSALVYPDLKRVAYGYDALNRMTTVTDWLGGTTTYAYDAAGNLASATNPNGTVARYSFDSAERLAALLNAKPDNSVISSYNLTLDAVGNRIAIDRQEPLAPVFAASNTAYTYDADNRLLTLNASGVTHDANGNLASKPGVGYQYDFEDRLIALSGAGNAQYGYDGVGHRLLATRSGSLTRYSLDVAGPLTNVIMESNGNGNPTAYYVHGLGLIVRITPVGDTSYYHCDTVGSTVAISNNRSATTDEYAYDPFGQALGQQGATPNSFRFVGKFGLLDEGGGLHYVRNRYYDTLTGRFVTKDTIQGSMVFTQSTNRYSYALANPLRFIDPAGLSPMETAASDRTLEVSMLLMESGSKLFSKAVTLEIRAAMRANAATGAYHNLLAEGSRLSSLAKVAKIVDDVVTVLGVAVDTGEEFGTRNWSWTDVNPITAFNLDGSTPLSWAQILAAMNDARDSSIAIGFNNAPFISQFEAVSSIATNHDVRLSGEQVTAIFDSIPTAGANTIQRAGDIGGSWAYDRFHGTSIGTFFGF